MRIKLGQAVMRVPETIVDEDREKGCPKKARRGVVVYIHPAGRYHTVEFDTVGGKIRESFDGVEDV